ncbi:M48 family metallopeptidase [Brevundimonas sp.]|uniref:M48 family metallopeptidase n=1 Tax=Brevundimonas sp. TaxID=1871086 RepID=UPI003A8CC9C3
MTLTRFVLPAALAALTLGGCAYNETLGRNQLLIVDNSALATQADAAWAQALRTQPVSRDAALNQRLRRVGDRIVAGANLGDRNWEYAVFVSDSPNAFVLPSYKIGVTTGLLALVKNDDQLATVIGHEVGHIVARHGAERASNSALGGLIQSGVGSYGDTAGGLAGVITQYGFLLPYSRRDELEADRLGVDYMQAAGYRPSQAIALWRLMGEQRQAATPEFASTHPSDGSRIAALEQYIASRGWN